MLRHEDRFPAGEGLNSTLHDTRTLIILGLIATFGFFGVGILPTMGMR